MEFALGRCSCFCIEIAYSNFNFCGSWTPSFFELNWKLSKFQENEHTPENELQKGAPSYYFGLLFRKLYDTERVSRCPLEHPPNPEGGFRLFIVKLNETPLPFSFPPRSLLLFVFENWRHISLSSLTVSILLPSCSFTLYLRYGWHWNTRSLHGYLTPRGPMRWISWRFRDVCPRSHPAIHTDLLTQRLIQLLGGHPGMHTDLLTQRFIKLLGGHLKAVLVLRNCVEYENSYHAFRGDIWAFSKLSHSYH